jgi:hypothetical protein
MKWFVFPGVYEAKKLDDLPAVDRTAKHLMFVELLTTTGGWYQHGVKITVLPRRLVRASVQPLKLLGSC